MYDNIYGLVTCADPNNLVYIIDDFYKDTDKFGQFYCEVE